MDLLIFSTVQFTLLILYIYIDHVVNLYRLYIYILLACMVGKLMLTNVYVLLCTVYFEFMLIQHTDSVCSTGC